MFQADTDGNQKLSMQEIREFLKGDPSISEEQIEAFVDACDENGDG